MSEPIDKRNKAALITAICKEAEDLKQRAAWHKKNIERGDRIIEAKLDSNRHHQAQLTAVNMALDQLRKEHKRLSGKAT